MKIKKGKHDDDFVISGNRESFIDVRRQLKALIDNTVSKHFDAKQPGLRRYFDSGNGDRLVKLVEKDQDCAIKVQMNFGHDKDGDGFSGGDGDDGAAAAADGSGGATAAAISDSDDGGRVSSDDEDDENEHAVSGTDPFTLVLNQGHHKISWKTGKIER